MTSNYKQISIVLAIIKCYQHMEMIFTSCSNFNKEPKNSLLVLCVFVQILLLVGTKMEIIIMEMAQEIQDRSTVVRGAPIVEPSNKFFWFNRPDWILLLIHITLFQVYTYTHHYTNFSYHWSSSDTNTNTIIIQF